MKLRSLLAAALVMCAAAAGAQSWSEISTSGNYLWGEGVGDTPEAADQQALAMLIRQVKVNVSDRMSLRDEMKRQGRTANYEQTVSHLIDSYSAAALDNTKALNMGKEGNQYKIGRYIARAEVDKIFASRRKKVVDMVKAADRAEQQGKVDVALRNLSWAF
ncbi:MAG: LPP20 family lipoprotein, partial [Muribaculaceae bacterium]|nr:LPP20 family lipoprotein [Muribaculaceae bacterium]